MLCMLLLIRGEAAGGLLLIFTIGNTLKLETVASSYFPVLHMITPFSWLHLCSRQCQL